MHRDLFLSGAILLFSAAGRLNKKNLGAAQAPSRRRRLRHPQFLRRDMFFVRCYFFLSGAGVLRNYPRYFLSGAICLSDAGVPKNSRPPEAPDEKGETLANSSQNWDEEHETLANSSKGEDAEHENLTNGSPNEDEEHENRCEWQQE